MNGLHSNSRNFFMAPSNRRGFFASLRANALVLIGFQKLNASAPPKGLNHRHFGTCNQVIHSSRNRRASGFALEAGFGLLNFLGPQISSATAGRAVKSRRSVLKEGFLPAVNSVGLSSTKSAQTKSDHFHSARQICSRRFRLGRRSAGWMI